MHYKSDEPIDDLGAIYESAPIEKGYDAYLKGQLEAPTAPIRNTDRRRQQGVAEYSGIRRFTRSPRYFGPSLLS